MWLLEKFKLHLWNALYSTGHCWHLSARKKTTFLLSSPHPPSLGWLIGRHMLWSVFFLLLGSPILVASVFSDMRLLWGCESCLVSINQGPKQASALRLTNTILETGGALAPTPYVLAQVTRESPGQRKICWGLLELDALFNWPSLLSFIS